ncbi:MAG: hypothetical protein V3T84_08375 [Phycisphaerales bacterium]
MAITPAKQLDDVRGVSDEDIDRQIADEVESSYESDPIRYNDLYERFPKSIATARLVREALGTAFQIHQRQGILPIDFAKLDGQMVAIGANVVAGRDEYAKVSLHDPPLGDWYGVSGSNPVEIAYNYFRHVHREVVQAMIPRGSKLTKQEQADAEALQQHWYRYILRPWESALKPEVILRRMPKVSNLSVRLGEPPSRGQMNVLRERLLRIEVHLTQSDEEPRDAGQKWFGAQWYDKRYNITAESLRQAKYRDKIRSRKRPGTKATKSTHNQYHLDDVRQRFPEHFQKL